MKLRSLVHRTWPRSLQVIWYPDSAPSLYRGVNQEALPKGILPHMCRCALALGRGGLGTSRARSADDVEEDEPSDSDELLEVEVLVEIDEADPLGSGDAAGSVGA